MKQADYNEVYSIVNPCLLQIYVIYLQFSTIFPCLFIIHAGLRSVALV